MFIEYKAINYTNLHCQHNHMLLIDQIVPQDCTQEVPGSIVGAFTLHCRFISQENSEDEGGEGQSGIF